MKLKITTLAKALNKGYLKQGIRREQIELLKANLARMFERIRSDESEEHLKNIVAEFLQDTWYKPDFEINTSGRKDLVIHNGSSSTDSVGVIIEVKRPANKIEMISPDKPNAKAMHELLHYYMQERYIKGNQEIRHLVISNIHEWYIFDAADFERFFFNNQKLVRSYKDWNDGILVGANTDWFYQEIAKKFIEDHLTELPCVCFDLRDYERIIRKKTSEITQKAETSSDVKLVNLYKILSPVHMLKRAFANDSNSLNREFYNELLHIIGLEEVKEKGKKLIRRKAPGNRDEGSLLENAINILEVQRTLEILENPAEFGNDEEERLFSIALELCITWLNRILFLKLLEGQVIAWNRDPDNRAFLNYEKVRDFGDLQELFFEVLARRIDDRSPGVASHFVNIPYLNSSLFEISDLERRTIQVSGLKPRLEIPLHGATVLKDSHGKRLSGPKNTLGYLLEFLDAYNFASDDSAPIQETPKTIINASVLGLIFEKINGYRDGSFYTPGFITMYMANSAIRRTVLQRFNRRYKWNCRDFTELYNSITRLNNIREGNDLINSLRVCDIAVGSGHFLVSALNEIIAIKSELGILADRDGKLLRCAVAVDSDELIVTVDDDLFVYNPRDPESRRIQETLFHEKEIIIENCLFGVDINPKSVAICRLRLWIELLKNAYYTKISSYSELETLPNIDINIKCGNSLISRFAISGKPNVVATERARLKELVERYKEKVWEYKLAPANKTIVRKDIARLKEELQTFAVPTDKDLIALCKIKNEMDQLGFGFSEEEMEKRHDLMAKEEELKRIVAEKQRTVYGNAFEWRFEFPEVLDNDGNFTGFDVVIGNPPYVRADAGDEHLSMRRQIMESGQFESLWEKWDLYVPFMELGYKLLRPNGAEAMIVSDAYCHSKYAQKSQEWFLKNGTVIAIDFIGGLDVFEEASVHNVICFFEKNDGAANRPARRLHKGEFGKFRLLPTDEQRNLSQRVFFPEEAEREGFSAPTVKLAEICYISKGMVVHADEKENKGAFELRDLVTDTPDEVHSKPFVEGKHLARWLPATRKWLEWGTGRAPALFSRPTFPELYEVAEKILILRVTGKDVIKAAYDDAILRCNHTAIVCVPWNELKGVRNKSLQKVARYDNEKSRPDLPKRKTLEKAGKRFAIKYILAVMNSKTASNFLHAIRRSNTDLYPDDWKKLPIPDVAAGQQAPVIVLVDQILAAKNADPKADISNLEADIDRLVNELYDQSKEDIAPCGG